MRYVLILIVLIVVITSSAALGINTLPSEVTPSSPNDLTSVADGTTSVTVWAPGQTLWQTKPPSTTTTTVIAVKAGIVTVYSDAGSVSVNSDVGSISVYPSSTYNSTGGDLYTPSVPYTLGGGQHTAAVDTAAADSLVLTAVANSFSSSVWASETVLAAMQSPLSATPTNSYTSSVWELGTQITGTHVALQTSAEFSALTVTETDTASITLLATDSVGLSVHPTATDNMTIEIPTTVPTPLMSSMVTMSVTSTTTSTRKPVTTRRPMTTTQDPKQIVKCRNRLPPTAANAHFEVVVPGKNSVLWYTCNPGFQQVSGTALVRCGDAVGWQSRDGRTNKPLLVCEAIEVDIPIPPPPHVPDWLIPMMAVGAVLLVSLFLLTLLLLLFSRRTIFTTQIHPRQLQGKIAENRQGWPWKSRRWQSLGPQGHLGPDGVAMLITNDLDFQALRNK